MTLDDAAFESLAEATLQSWFDAIDAAAPDGLDCDLQGGALTLDLDDGRTFVLSKHGPTRQLWLSSPLSGATHFDYDAAGKRWRSTRGTADLAVLLSGELSQLLGHRVELETDGGRS